MFISLWCASNFPFPHREQRPVAVSNAAVGMGPALPHTGRARQGRAPAWPYLIRRHAACCRACRKHMSLVKQIVKASITSLWRSRTEFVPTAKVSCTLSSRAGPALVPAGCFPVLVLPSPHGDGAAPWGAVKHHPERQIGVSTLSPPQDAPLCLQTCPMGSSGMEKASPKMHGPSPGSPQQIMPRASCTAAVAGATCACGSSLPEPSNSLAGPQPLAVPWGCLAGARHILWARAVQGGRDSPALSVPEELHAKLSRGVSRGSAASPGAICSRGTLITLSPTPLMGL